MEEPSPDERRLAATLWRRLGTTDFRRPCFARGDWCAGRMPPTAFVISMLISTSPSSIALVSGEDGRVPALKAGENGFWFSWSSEAGIGANGLSTGPLWGLNDPVLSSSMLRSPFSSKSIPCVPACLAANLSASSNRPLDPLLELVDRADTIDWFIVSSPSSITTDSSSCSTSLSEFSSPSAVTKVSSSLPAIELPSSGLDPNSVFGSLEFIGSIAELCRRRFF